MHKQKYAKVASLLIKSFRMRIEPTALDENGG